MRETEHRRADDGRPHDRNALRKSGEDEPAKEGLLGERRGDGDGHEVEQEVFGAVVLEQDERLELRGLWPKDERLRLLYDAAREKEPGARDDAEHDPAECGELAQTEVAGAGA